jgi:prefoldin subunit 5
MNQLTELKAKAYDLIAQLEIIQRQLSEINNKIAELLKKEQDNDGGNSDVNN